MRQSVFLFFNKGAFMRHHPIIRYIGILLLAVSFLTMLSLYSYSYFGIGQDGNRDRNISVLLVSEGEPIPQIEMRAIFRGMGLSFSAVQMTKDSDPSNKQLTLEEAIRSIQSDQVILLATQKSAYLSILSTVSSDKIAGIVLLSPEISPSEDLSFFGAQSPSIPTTFIAPDDDYVRTLYERLSGEDARLFPGIKENGLLPYEVYTSPNGKRSLSVWSGFGTSPVMKTLFAFFPGVTEEIGGQIGSFVLGDAKTATEARATAQTVRILISSSAILSIAGLCFFMASIPIPKKRMESTIDLNASQTEGETTSPLSGERESLTPDAFSDSSTRLWYKKKTLIIEILFGSLMTVVMVVLFFVRREFCVYPALYWPVFYYAFLLPYLPSRANQILDRRVPPARFVLSGAVTLLFFITCMSLMISIRPDPIRMLISFRAALALIFAIALFFFVQRSILSGITFCVETLSRDVFSSENKVWTSGLRVLIFLPSVVLFILSASFGELHYMLTAVFYLASIFLAIYFRYVFRTIGGTAKAGAIAFAAFLMTVSFL